MHIPLRMCIACRQMKPQNELIRFVREINTGNIMLDTDKKLMGRGAYIWNQPSLFFVFPTADPD